MHSVIGSALCLILALTVFIIIIIIIMFVYWRLSNATNTEQWHNIIS